MPGETERNPERDAPRRPARLGWPALAALILGFLAVAFMLNWKIYELKTGRVLGADAWSVLVFGTLMSFLLSGFVCGGITAALWFLFARFGGTLETRPGLFLLVVAAAFAGLAVGLDAAMPALVDFDEARDTAWYSTQTDDGTSHSSPAATALVLFGFEAGAVLAFLAAAGTGLLAFRTDVRRKGFASAVLPALLPAGAAAGLVVLGASLLEPQLERAKGLRGLQADDPAARLAAARAVAAEGDPRAVEVFARLLREGADGDLRAAAAEGLFHCTDPAAAATDLRTALKDRDPRVRGWAVRALGRGDDPAHAALFAPLLLDADESVRALAAAEIARREAVIAPALRTAFDEAASSGRRPILELECAEPLVLSLRMGRDHERAAAAALLGEGGLVVATPALLAALGDAEPRVVLEAVKALTLLADPRAAGPLAALAAHERRDLRMAVWQALKILGGDEAVKGLLEAALALERGNGGAAFEALATLDLAGRADRADLAARVAPALADSAKREGALAVLLRLGEPAVPVLVAACEKPDRSLRRAAVAALGTLSSPASVPALVGLLDDASVRDEAAAALGRIGEPAVEPLLKALDHPKREARIAAAEALGRVGTPRAVRPLLAWIQEGDRAAQFAARKALAAIGEPALDSLVELLADPDRAVRFLALRILSEIGGETVRAPLLDALRGPDEDFRRVAAEGLKRWKDPEVVGALASGLADPADAVRRASSRSLAEIADPSTAAALAAALGDAVSHVRSAAKEGLTRIGAPAVPALLAALKEGRPMARRTAAAALSDIGDPRAVAGLVAALRDHAARREALAGLRQMKWEPQSDADRCWRLLAGGGDWDAVAAMGAAALPSLVAALKDEDDFLRRRAAEALGAIGDPSAAPPLVAALRDPGRSVRVQAAKSLDALGWAPGSMRERVDLELARGSTKGAVALGAEAVEALLEVLAGDDAGLRRMAAYVLGEIGDGRARPALFAALDDDSDGVRPAAAEALVKTGWEPADDGERIRYLAAKGEWEAILGQGEIARAPLEAMTAQARDAGLRRAACWALGRIGKTASTPALVAALADADDAVFKAAAKALQTNPDAQGARGLVAALAVEDLDRRKAAADALAAMGDAALEPLVEALEGSDAALRIRAAALLAAITKEEFFGEDAARWRSWLEKRK